MKKCGHCGEDVEMMTGRNKYVDVHIANSYQEEDMSIEIHVEKCPNCNKIEVYEN